MAKVSEKDFELDKTLASKLVEFVWALQLIRDSLEGLRESKPYFNPALAGQLRALLIDDMKHAGPLLFDLAQELGVDTRIFKSAPLLAQLIPPEARDSIVLETTGLPLTRHRTTLDGIAVDFKDFLTSPVITYNGVKYTSKTIIGWFANRSGGAHYSRKMPRPLAEMLTLPAFLPQPVYQVLSNIGSIVVDLGRDILSVIFGYQLDLIFAFNASPKAGLALLSALHPTGMELQLLLSDQCLPVVKFTGLDSLSSWFSADRALSPGTVYHATITLDIQRNLHTRMSIIINGEEYASGYLKAPVLIATDWLEYDVFLNRLSEAEAQDFELAVGDIAAFSRTMKGADAARVATYLDQKRQNMENLLIKIPNGSYGRSQIGSSDYVFEGDATQVATGDYIGEKT